MFPDAQAPANGQAPEAAVAASVRVEMSGRGGSGTHLGGGKILTAKHVALKVGDSATVIFPSGRDYRGTVQAVADRGDLALILCPGAEREPAAELAPSLTGSREAWQMGYPAPARTFNVRHGKFTGTNGPPGMGTVNFVSTAPESGDSGGGVFDENGKLVGVIEGREIHGKFGLAVTYRDTCAFLQGRVAGALFPGIRQKRQNIARGADAAQNALAELQAIKDNLAAIQADVAKLQRTPGPASPGPAGPTGPAGPQGPQGPAGTPGQSADASKLAALADAQAKTQADLNSLRALVVEIDQALKEAPKSTQPPAAPAQRVRVVPSGGK